MKAIPNNMKANAMAKLRGQTFTTRSPLSKGVPFALGELWAGKLMDAPKGKKERRGQ
jgi:hypothetical protein